MSTQVKSVLLVGASGSIGPFLIPSLLASNFNVSVLTRETSEATFPSGVTVYRTDYSSPSLLQAFKNQDAVISLIAAFSTSEQVSIIDAAIAAGIKRFIPSEYGIDTSIPEASTFVPVVKPKQDTIAHLRTKEREGLSWTALSVGSFFDWTFEHPGLMGWNVPERRATIYDDGNYEYEATNVAQIARAITAILAPQHLEETKNKYVYINSFTITQNKVLKVLEKVTGERFLVENKKVEELWKEGLQETDPMTKALKTITAAIYGNGGVNNYSKTRELWNKRLGLPEEDMEESLVKVLRVVGELKR